MSRSGRGPEFGKGAGPMVRGGRRVAGQRLGPVAREQLGAAHQLARDGRFAEAAPALERIAQIARERSMSRMASHLSARAAACHARAGDEAGLLRAVQASMLDARTEGDPQHAARTFGDLVAELRATSFAPMADRLESTVRDALGVSPRVPSAPVDEATEASLNRTRRRTSLPSACDHCGAAVSGGAIRWNEDSSADCPACGCLLTA